MTIPIPSTLVNDAVTINTQFSALPIVTCIAPNEGAKCVSFQIDGAIAPYTNKANFLVDLSKGTSGPPLSQIAAIYIDLTNAQSDVTIFVPSTGYQVIASRGTCNLYPMFMGKGDYKFYVSRSVITTGETINITMLNQFIPEFNTTNFLKSISYGQGTLTSADVQPFVSRTVPFATVADMSFSTFPVTLVSGVQLLSSIDISVRSLASVADSFHVIRLLYPLNGNVMQFPFYAQMTTSIQKLVSLANLMIIGPGSLGGGSLQLSIDNLTNLTDLRIYANGSYVQNVSP